MNQLGRLKKYAELFKKNFQPYLAKGIRIDTSIYPVTQGGAVFEFKLKSTTNNKINDTFKIMPENLSVGKVLSQIPQNIFSGDFNNVRFGGTNLSLESNRILVIKGEDDRDQWSGTAVLNDVSRVVSGALASNTK